MLAQYESADGKSLARKKTHEKTTITNVVNTWSGCGMRE
jgi:hypothetical protein